MDLWHSLVPLARGNHRRATTKKSVAPIIPSPSPPPLLPQPSMHYRTTRMPDNGNYFSDADELCSSSPRLKMRGKFLRKTGGRFLNLVRLSYTDPELRFLGGWSKGLYFEFKCIYIHTLAARYSGKFPSKHPVPRGRTSWSSIWFGFLTQCAPLSGYLT